MAKSRLRPEDGTSHFIARPLGLAANAHSVAGCRCRSGPWRWTWTAAAGPTRSARPATAAAAPTCRDRPAPAARTVSAPPAAPARPAAARPTVQGAAAPRLQGASLLGPLGVTQMAPPYVLVCNHGKLKSKDGSRHLLRLAIACCGVPALRSVMRSLQRPLLALLQCAKQPRQVIVM